ncbi:Hsp20/alpha crystallin family protein [Marvinbryantia formatexigens DSM 14469]|uniref:Hsp20/alpha crystallin family protein n=1 Tax=Marvinbryantia formatexigens DSM 14469 TaxID=478749 RepID=C6LD32_9FIRM|nr:Hsp20/alpha crystallin family protein [Marvinbryantia formatexigens]EET61515.1 Hsp20/alpha crystallin family protein [Marvinbryantia formatexigens DSM 14469]UWO26166.1 Hsp20/alpha crystallin family protein [Marvinbryantia formatexigens DSM 14469]SDF93100.1 Molecular chaperone IbpA, HSP20 family [Marvinbryantia formatexigens]
MMMPSIFGRDMFDDFFGYPFDVVRTSDAVKSTMMQTDVKETDQGYEVTMNIPGVKKEDVKAELKDGYLTIQATTNGGNDEKDNNGRYIRRERHYGTCSRSFYVGEEVKQEEIKARFEDGTLKLFVPKKDAKQTVEQKKYITIEG